MSRRTPPILHLIYVVYYPSKKGGVLRDISAAPENEQTGNWMRRGYFIPCALCSHNAAPLCFPELCNNKAAPRYLLGFGFRFGLVCTVLGILLLYKRLCPGANSRRPKRRSRPGGHIADAKPGGA